MATHIIELGWNEGQAIDIRAQKGDWISLMSTTGGWGANAVRLEVLSGRVRFSLSKPEQEEHGPGGTFGMLTWGADVSNVEVLEDGTRLIGSISPTVRFVGF